MMVYEDVIVMYNVYNNYEDYGKVLVVVNDIEMKVMDDQAMVVDIELLMLVAADLIDNDEIVMMTVVVVSVLNQTKIFIII